ncbi:putative F-box domain, galactose oxidase/kelch, beta-propeller, F-box associated interaction [Medicago truncatula]|uniref:F-box protein interaction domain protein n=1 Tax=Medicago truncatula TaxID=3880 RepID=A0A072VP87_MEDTR|nr:F-box/kelch-repeat protein At3g23880 [Medicago truncatula]KEH43627.1 F-box protein interaction domain protein [Medicago truncatula]RHN81624.1 putative F-box domain, galactose oxidase/kelch, beta-propeller, F-box associated interaction [Medicago truncatula]
MGDDECTVTTMSVHHSPNDTVCTQPLPDDTTVNNQQLPSPTADVLSKQLPKELIIEILLRLPVKSLLQFKCICKSWKTLISDPQFANNHFLTSTAYPQLLSAALGVCRNPYEILSYPVKPLLENLSTPITPLNFSTGHCYDILGSCNGLICLYDIHQSNFTLWNPSINLKSRTYPTIASSDNDVVVYHGFGYDQINDKYKVLVVVEDEDEDEETLETVTRIYTFGENSCTTVPNFPCDPHSNLGIYVSGTLNWVGNKNNKEMIISIDLEKEIRGEVLLPQHDDADNARSSELYVLSDCLCMCFDKETHWTVWRMKEYGVVESWTKLMIIPHEEFQLTWNPLFMSENGVVLVRTTRSILVLYNLNNGQIDYHKIWDNLVGEMHIHRESLVSP